MLIILKRLWEAAIPNGISILACFLATNFLCKTEHNDKT